MTYLHFFFVLGFIASTLGCNNKETNHQDSKQLVQLEVDAIEDTSMYEKIIVHQPSVIELMVDDLDMNEYEKGQARQEYYALSDFQAYYSQVVIPVIDSMSIDKIQLHDRKIILLLENKEGQCLNLNVNKIKFKQGVILYNGEQAVFWRGDISDELSAFIRQFFKKSSL